MNKCLVDSDVVLNAILETEKQDICVEFLDQKENEINSTILNIMEISSVLSRKYQWEGEDIREVINTVEKGMDVLIPSESEILEGYELVFYNFYSPVDAILLTLSKNQDQVLITYDKELLKRGVTHTDVKRPDEFIE